MENSLKILSILLLLFAPILVKGENIDVYKIDLSKLEKYDVIKKGTEFDSTLNTDIFTKTNKKNNSVSFKVSAYEDRDLDAYGIVSKSSTGKRFQRQSSLELALNMIVLEDGREVNISASTPIFSSINQPHADSSTAGIARAISTVALGTSPLTFGAGLGVSFLISGFLSARQNGISDFLWGGLDGSGLSFVEHIFRKQPDVNLALGTTIPFILNEDLKISKGIKKEQLKEISTSKEEAIAKIKKLIEWGDLSGALEYSIKTGQKDFYEDLIKKISS